MTAPETSPRPLFDRSIARVAAWEALKKLHPRRMLRNPVLFVVELGSAFTTVIFIHSMVAQDGEARPGFILAVSIWLWFTVLFANFAEAMAEGRGKAQAESLRRARQDVVAKRARDAAPDGARWAEWLAGSTVGIEPVSSSALRKGHLVVVLAGELIPPTGRSWTAWPPSTRAPSPARAPP